MKKKNHQTINAIKDILLIHNINQQNDDKKKLTLITDTRHK